jgi:hypothetical protein
MSSTWYTIKDDQSSTTEGLVEQLNKHDKKIKEAEDKRKKKESKEQQGGEDPAAAFRAANFICTRPLGPRIVIPRTRFSDGAIQAHKENCDYCKEKEQAKIKEQQAYVDGHLYMMYQLSIIAQMKDAADTLENRIKREREEKKEGWEYAVRRAKRDIDLAGVYRQKAEEERDRLLNLQQNNNNNNHDDDDDNATTAADPNYVRGVIDMYKEWKSVGFRHHIQLEPKYYWYRK